MIKFPLYSHLTYELVFVDVCADIEDNFEYYLISIGENFAYSKIYIYIFFYRLVDFAVCSYLNE